MKRNALYSALFMFILACSCYGLWPRFELESRNKNIAIISDYREILALSKSSGMNVDDAIDILIRNGITGIMVSELTGDNIERGTGQAELKKVRDPERGTEGIIVSILPTSEHKDILNKWLRIRFAVSDDKTSGPLLITLPSSVLKNSGMLPDIDGLEAAKRSGLKIYYRPASSPGHLSDQASIMLREVNALYPISVFTPAGEYVSGYPDVSMMARTANELHIPLAVVEFSRQAGEPQLNALVSPNLLALHSVTNEEMTSRRISRAALRDRLVRAAVERSVRLLLLRSAPSNTSNFRFNDYAEEVRLLAEELKSHGLNLSWPETVYADYNLNKNIFASWALSAVFIFALFRYLSRMGLKMNMKTMYILAGLSVIMAFIVLKVPFVARITGAFTAPLIAVEASLLAMDSGRKRNIIPAFVFAVLGGLALASFFSVTSFMMRLETFSGVKLTLVLPPVLVLMHDLKRRIHPESLIEFLSRPPLWGEIILYGVLLGGVAFIVYRSDNVANVSGFEMSIRNSLERMLVARPRTREVFLGYPCVLILSYLVSNNFFARYREIFRIGTALGFSSVINSFCHFHTPLTIILLREFNGLWTGLIVGLIIVLMIKFILVPLLRLIRPLIS